jgi:hypothetical protein
MAALAEPPSPSAASVHQAQARASRRRALSLLLPPADMGQSRGGPTSLTPTSQLWQGLKRPAAASRAPLLPSHAGLRGSRAAPGAALSPLLPPWALAAACVPGGGAPGSRPPAVAPAKRPRPLPLLPGSGGAGPLPLPPPWWPGPPGPQQLTPQPPQQQVMVVCSSCAPSGPAAMAGGDVGYDPASPGAPTLPQLQQAGPHPILAPGLSTQPPSWGLLQQHQQQLAAGMLVAIRPPALGQQWGASGMQLVACPPPPAAALLPQSMLQAWQTGSAGPPEAIAPGLVWPEAPPGAGAVPGHSQAPPAKPALQQLPLAGAAAVPAAAGWPWLRGQAAVQGTAGDACCRVSAGAAPPGEQRAGMGDEAWGSTWCMPGASTGGSNASLPVLQEHRQPQLLQQEALARQSLVAAHVAHMDDLAAVGGGSLAGGSSYRPAVSLGGAGTYQGHAVLEGALSEEELDQDLALMWHLLATDQDPQQRSGRRGG